MKNNPLSLQSSVVGRANLKTYITAAKLAGFDLIEPTKTQLTYFLDAGYKLKEIKNLLGEIKISSVGWLSNIDRQGYEFIDMMREAEELFALAESVGSGAVEILNGPVDWHATDAYKRGLAYNGYMGLQGLAIEEQEEIMIKNMRALSDLAAQFHLDLFFEPLAWTVFPSLKEGIPLVERVDRNNLKIVVDFYHNYISGVDSEFLSRIDPELILGVHICNSKEPNGLIPCEEVFRDVGFYEGNVPIKEWVDAIKSTGFKGWWAYETFSKKEAEEEIYSFTKDVYNNLKALVQDNVPNSGHFIH